MSAKRSRLVPGRARQGDERQPLSGRPESQARAKRLPARRSGRGYEATIIGRTLYLHTPEGCGTSQRAQLPSLRESRKERASVIACEPQHRARAMSTVSQVATAVPEPGHEAPRASDSDNGQRAGTLSCVVVTTGRCMLATLADKQICAARISPSFDSTSDVPARQNRASPGCETGCPGVARKLPGARRERRACLSRGCSSRFLPVAAWLGSAACGTGDGGAAGR
jgi:hypothetical protein